MANVLTETQAKEVDTDTAKFKGAIKKFQQLFSMPPEEKLVNCKHVCIMHARGGMGG